MNNGLSDALKATLPNIIPVPRPLVEKQEIKDPNWLAGFTDAEGCFYIILRKSLCHKLKTQIRLKFILTQNCRDAALLKSLVQFFGCGSFRPSSNNCVNYDVEKFSDISTKIIPFFDKYPLQGAKVLDFKDFKKVANFMENKEHLTQEGLEQIKQIKSGMNRGRDLDKTGDL